MGLIDRFLVRGTVTDVQRVGRRMKRVRITGEGIAGLRPRPGQQIRLVVGELFSMDLVRNDAVRTYSIWDHSAAEAALDLCMLDHAGAGPGARFAQRVAVGTEVRFAGPEGKLVYANDASAHVFFGEETAQVAFGAIRRAIPRGTPVLGAIEVESPEDVIAIEDVAPLETRVRRTAVGSELIEAARTLAVPEGASVYVAGEAKSCKEIRRVLVSERGVPRSAVHLKPFWTPGAKGLE